MNVALTILDDVRRAVLQRTLEVPRLRGLFVRREERLPLAFLLGTSLTLPLAVFQPWLLLAAGPALFGLTHLGATIRFGAKALREDRRRPVALFLALILGAVAAYRLVTGTPDNLAELAGCAVLLVALLVARVLPVRQILLAAVLLSPLFVASREAPRETIQVLIILHNFVGFFFWIRAARRSGEVRAPVFCLGVFSVIHAAIFLLPGENFEVAYAYGQASHYFVWLKAIPEQSLDGSAPVSFGRSFKLLGRDFGRFGARLAVLLVVGLSAAWLLVSWEEARRLYFAVAAFHGYAEITLLAVLASCHLIAMPHSYHSDVRSPHSPVLSTTVKDSPT